LLLLPLLWGLVVDVACRDDDDDDDVLLMWFLLMEDGVRNEPLLILTLERGGRVFEEDFGRVHEITLEDTT
jgi:hypothetical protein